MSEADPLTRATGGPTAAPSIWNWIVPDGVPLVGWAAETVAVKVSVVPAWAGFPLDVTEVVVATTTGPDCETVVVAWAAVAVCWTLPTLSVATL